MDATCWGKATRAGEPSNERNPNAVAVLEDVGEGAAGGSGCATCPCTLKPKASICSGYEYHLRVGSWKLLSALGQIHNKDMRS